MFTRNLIGRALDLVRNTLSLSLSPLSTLEERPLASASEMQINLHSDSEAEIFIKTSSATNLTPPSEAPPSESDGAKSPPVAIDETSSGGTVATPFKSEAEDVGTGSPPLPSDSARSTTPMSSASGDTAISWASMATWTEGDIAWARIGASPYWPCIVAADSASDPPIFFRVTERSGGASGWRSAASTSVSSGSVVGTIAHREFHVFFLGTTIKRAWMNAAHMLDYDLIEGKTKLTAIIDAKVKATNSKAVKLKLRKSVLRAGINRPWDEAVNDAARLAKLTTTERVDYVVTTMDRQLSGGSAAFSSTSGNSGNSGNRKRKAITDVATLQASQSPGVSIACAATAKQAKIDDISLATIDKLIDALPDAKRDRRRLKSGFTLFRAVRLHAMDMTDSGDGQQNDGKSKAQSRADNREAERIINHDWSVMTVVQRRHYQMRIATLFDPPPTPPPPPSSVPPSKRNEIAGASLTKRLQTVDINNATSDAGDTDDTDDTASQASSRASTAESAVSVMLGLFRREPCCVVCENVASTDCQADKQIVTCHGSCHRSYHVSCISQSVPQASTDDHQDEDVPLADVAKRDGINIAVDTWTCDECSSDTHRCQVCGSSDPVTPSTGSAEEGVVKCSATHCGRHFHVACLAEAPSHIWPQTRVQPAFMCPAHVCHTCASDDPRHPVMKYNKPLLRCIRCPTAYHANDYCVAAGSVQITATDIICPKHVGERQQVGGKREGSNVGVSQHHLNASWCFICSRGGSLICCDRCPASCHVDCVNEDVPAEGQYFCDNCSHGRMPLYNEIIWVKLGRYRWWPAKVLHPTHVPDNIERMAHRTGEFPIQFLGTREYHWTSVGRCFLYDDGDSDRIPQVSASGGSSASGGGKSLTSAFVRGVREAALLYTSYQDNKRLREEQSMRRQKHKPPPYTRIKTNRPTGDCPIGASENAAREKRESVCECKPLSAATNSGDDSAERDVACDDNCLNRILLTECTASTCPAGSQCGNRRFQNRQYPKMRVCYTQRRGWGLLTEVDIKAGQFVIEYVGELISMEEFRKRMEAKMRAKDTNFYFMGLDANRMIDAGAMANLARFMNHSCQPNCETQKWTVNGDTRVGLFAITNIPAGTELSFNYQLEVEAGTQGKTECRCGAINCSGFIGEKAKTAPPTDLPSDTSAASAGKRGDDVAKRRRRKRLKTKKELEESRRSVTALSKSSKGDSSLKFVIKRGCMATAAATDSCDIPAKAATSDTANTAALTSGDSEAKAIGGRKVIVGGNWQNVDIDHAGDRVYDDEKLGGSVASDQSASRDVASDFVLPATTSVLQLQPDPTARPRPSPDAKRPASRQWDDYCFRCYEEGELLLCDTKRCRRSYHLACVGRTKMPREKWYCPWHHCVTCGKAASIQCQHCPNAYCKLHASDAPPVSSQTPPAGWSSVVRDDAQLGVICWEHAEDEHDARTFFHFIAGGATNIIDVDHGRQLSLTKNASADAQTTAMPKSDVKAVDAKSASDGRESCCSPPTVEVEMMAGGVESTCPSTATCVSTDDRSMTLPESDIDGDIDGEMTVCVADATADKQLCDESSGAELVLSDDFDDDVDDADEAGAAVGIGQLFAKHNTANVSAELMLNDNDEEMGDEDDDDGVDASLVDDSEIGPATATTTEHVACIVTFFQRKWMETYGHKADGSGIVPLAKVGQHRRMAVKDLKCRCVESVECAWSGKKVRLVHHLVTVHGMDHDEARVRYRQVMNLMSFSSAAASLLATSPVAIHLCPYIAICPDVVCRLKLRQAAMARHVATAHRNLSTENNWQRTLGAPSTSDVWECLVAEDAAADARLVAELGTRDMLDVFLLQYFDLPADGGSEDNATQLAIRSPNSDETAARLVAGGTSRFATAATKLDNSISPTAPPSLTSIAEASEEYVCQMPFCSYRTHIRYNLVRHQRRQGHYVDGTSPNGTTTAVALSSGGQDGSGGGVKSWPISPSAVIGSSRSETVGMSHAADISLALPIHCIPPASVVGAASNSSKNGDGDDDDDDETYGDVIEIDDDDLVSD